MVAKRLKIGEHLIKQKLFRGTLLYLIGRIHKDVITKMFCSEYHGWYLR